MHGPAEDLSDSFGFINSHGPGEKNEILTTSLDDVLGLLRKWKSESTPLRVVAVVVGDIVTVNFRGSISDQGGRELSLGPPSHPSPRDSRGHGVLSRIWLNFPNMS